MILKFQSIFAPSFFLGLSFAIANARNLIDKVQEVSSKVGEHDLPPYLKFPGPFCEKIPVCCLKVDPGKGEVGLNCIRYPDDIDNNHPLAPTCVELYGLPHKISGCCDWCYGPNWKAKCGHCYEWRKYPPNHHK